MRKFGHLSEHKAEANRAASLFIPTAENARIDLCDDHLKAVVDTVDSLLRDLARLKAASDSFERYLILVLQMTGTTDKFGKAISAIRITHEETTFDYPGVKVRIWKIG